MTAIRFALTSAILILCVACSPSPEPRPPAPLPADKLESCHAACMHLRGENGSGWDCDLGKPTKRGITCETVCETMEQNGQAFISCVEGAASCQAAEACE